MGRLKTGDAVIYYNILGEREVELTESLTGTAFDKFPVEKDLRLKFCTMIEYQKGLPVRVAFPLEETIPDTLSEIIARHNLKQAKVTESEKASHVGFFLNGKNADLLPGKERIIVPSRRELFSLIKPRRCPSMLSRRNQGKDLRSFLRLHFINFPNVDVVGHIDNQAAIIRAVESVDTCMGSIVDTALKEGMTAIVSSDHGTVRDGCIRTAPLTQDTRTARCLLSLPIKIVSLLSGREGNWQI